MTPGMYLVLASGLQLDTSPETIGKLPRAKAKAKEVDVSAGATAQVTLEYGGWSEKSRGGHVRRASSTISRVRRYVRGQRALE